jgi:hypothetical protein
MSAPFETPHSLPIGYREGTEGVSGYHPNTLGKVLTPNSATSAWVRRPCGGPTRGCSMRPRPRPMTVNIRTQSMITLGSAGYPWV